MKEPISFFSFPPQQQANLIPGLNLNALGIFSSGLPVLPPAAGPRGAVSPVAPAGYNPFLVSTKKKKKMELFSHCWFYTPSLAMHGSSSSSNLFPTQGAPGSPWSVLFFFVFFFPIMLTQIFVHEVVHSLKQAEFPHLLQMSQLLCKTKSPLIVWRGQAKVVWDSAWECVYMLDG